MQLLFKGEVYKIIGAAMEVHRILGCGFLEAVYQEALSIEFQERNLPFSEQEKLRIIYKHKILKKEYTPDFICYDKIILELKALAALTPDHEAQLLNYLKATGYKLGLLINFGTASLQYKRMIL
jgi:GxxExxY protein